MKKNFFPGSILTVITLLTISVLYVQKQNNPSHDDISHEIAIAIDKQESVCGTELMLPRIVTIQKGQSLCSALRIDSTEASTLAHTYGMNIGTDVKGRENPIVHAGEQFIYVPLPNGDSVWAPNFPQFYDWVNEDSIALNK